jgi:hypothetical protein
MASCPTVLWSDFDGTAVESVDAFKPRSWVKYPLAVRPGYTQFVKHIGEHGIVIGGVATRRPNVWVRRIATRHTIQRSTLRELFGSTPLVHNGSEYAKARFLVDQSRLSVVIMLEDRPDKLGVRLLDVMNRQPHGANNPHFPIVLAVVASAHSQERMSAFVARLSRGLDVHRHPTKNTLCISTNGYVLHVVVLDDYSAEAAARLVTHSQTPPNCFEQNG